MTVEAVSDGSYRMCVSCDTIFEKVEDSSPPSATYRHQRTGSSLVQVMAFAFQRQAITWTNAGLLPIGLVKFDLNSFSFQEMCLKMPSA